MGSHVGVLVVAGLLAGAGLMTASPSAVAAPGPGPWSAAEATPQANALSSGGYAVERSTSCPTPGFCVAVGYYLTTLSNPTFTYFVNAPAISVFADGTWTTQAAPLPAGARTGINEQGGLASVSCPAPGACVAVGTVVMTSGGRFPLVEALSDGVWSATTMPVGPQATAATEQSAGATSISCPVAGSCAAVGEYRTTADSIVPAVYTLSDGAWSAQTAPTPAARLVLTRTATLKQIDCPAPGTCTAVGDYFYAGVEKAELVTVSGGLLSATAGPLPSTVTPTEPDAVYRSVSCPAVGSCMAVGSYVSKTTKKGTVMGARLSSGTWSDAFVPEPSDFGKDAGDPSDSSTMTSVSCTTIQNCVAVGTVIDTDDRWNGLIDTLSAGSWTAQLAPEPAGSASDADHLQRSGLTAVDCWALSYCTAVGYYTTATDDTYGWIDSLRAGVWYAQAAPSPANAGAPDSTIENSDLVAVSCAGGACSAVGYYLATGTDTLGLLDTAGEVPGGYDEIASDGGIFAFTVPFLGSMGGKPLNAPIVTAAADPLTGGYYEVASDGGMFSFTAPFHGSMGGEPLNAPIVGMAFDTRTGGYYEVASDGGIFAFTAPFHGSMGGKPLNEPIVGMAFDPATGGYWLVASDGGLFAFTAPFLGSMGGKPLNEPIVGMTFDTITGGYYEVASDGGLFAFTAPFHGSMGGKPLNQPIVAMAFDPGTGGYWEVASDGGLFSFTAPFHGSMGGRPLNEPIVTMVVG